MKSCEFTTSEASTKSWFRTNGLIDKFLNILDLNKFRIKNTEFSNYAKTQYGVEGRLFYEEQSGKKAFPNTTLFHQIDAAKGNWYKENEYLKNRQFQKQSLSLTTEQTNQIEELKQSDPRWNKYSNEDIQRFIDSVFPESQVKEIVYHGTDLEPNSVDFKTNRGGIFLASTPIYASYFSEQDNAYPALINFKNGYQAKGLTDNVGKDAISQIKARGYDSVIGKGGITKMQQHKNDLEFIAFELPQVYILNSDKAFSDMEKFVGNDNIAFSRKPSNFVRNVNELGEQFEKSLTSISTPTKVLKELENKLINGFLKDFNIDVTEYENFKQEIGFDAYSASDLVTKAIAYQKGESILPEVAYFAYSIMGKQNNKIKSQLKYLISKWDKYNERFEHHKQTVNKNYGFIKDVKEWRQKVSDLVILDFLKENIENHYFNPQAFTRVLDSKWTSEDFTIWQKFMNWIENLLSSFSSSYKKKQQILNNIGISIADEVLNQNYTYFNYPLKKEQVQKYYKETIETDDYAKELVEFGQSIGLVLTGSLALRKAGSVYRTLDETIHDVDFVVPFEKLLNQPQLFEKVVKNRLFEKEAFEKEFMENIFPNLSWLKEFKTKYPEYRVLAAFIGSEHAQNKESMSVGGVIGGEFYTEDGTHVEDISYYTKNEETKAPVKVTTQKTVLHKKGDWIKDTGYVVDFFVRLYPKQEQHENYFKLWKEIMIAKLKMGREKDLIDWKAFIPFTKSLNSFNFNYEGFRHINFDSSQKYQVNATNIKSTIVSESFKEEKGESNTECFL